MVIETSKCMLRNDEHVFLNLAKLSEGGVYIFSQFVQNQKDFPGGSAGKESACNVGDLGSIPGLGRAPGEGRVYSLQYSGLENSMDCMEWGRKELDTTERFSLNLKQSQKIVFFSYCILNYYQILNMSPCYCLVAKSCLFATPWTVACQAPLSMGFPRQENWSGFPVLLQGIFPTQGLNLRLLLGRQILYDWATWEAPLGNCFRDRIHVLFQVWVAGECNQMNPRRRDCRGGLGRVVEVCSCERVGLGCVCC